MSFYRGASGKTYQLSKSLGAGGEGIVYDLLNDNSHVVKIYKAGHFKSAAEKDAMERKLKTMISMNLTGYVGNMLMFTWPLDILFENGKMVGYVMPKTRSDFKIFSIYRMGPDVKRVYPSFNWKYSVQFAYNLAWVVQYLHSYGIVVGDLNQNNICVDSKTGAVILIDCDSFDIRDPVTGEHFPCTVGFSEVLAPELQVVGNLRNGQFTKESDNFSLAIHIFRLLMRNADPFGGIISAQASSSSVTGNRAIINGECQYVREVGKKLPSWSPRLSAMPREIQDLFRKTFDYSSVTSMKRRKDRATAEEWCMALLPYARPEPNRKLKKCRHNRLHVYPAHNRKCPWCECEGYKTEEEFRKKLQKLQKLLASLQKGIPALMTLFILAGIAGLCYTAFTNQVRLNDIFGNIAELKKDFRLDHLMYAADSIKGAGANILSNIKRMGGRFEDPAVICKRFVNNNTRIFSHLREGLQNILVMMPALTDRIKNIIPALKNRS